MPEGQTRFGFDEGNQGTFLFLRHEQERAS